MNQRLVGKPARPQPNKLGLSCLLLWSARDDDLIPFLSRSDRALPGGPPPAVRVPVDLIPIDLAVLPLDLHDVGDPGGLAALRADRDLGAHA